MLLVLDFKVMEPMLKFAACILLKSRDNYIACFLLSTTNGFEDAVSDVYQ